MHAVGCETGMGRGEDTSQVSVLQESLHGCDPQQPRASVQGALVLGVPISWPCCVPLCTQHHASFPQPLR